MTELWVDIERLALDGICLDPARGRRLADLTEMALERLLRERGVSAGLRGDHEAREKERAGRGDDMGAPPADETRWANELAEILYRAIDRSA